VATSDITSIDREKKNTNLVRDVEEKGQEEKRFRVSDHIM
jgi:hypothetical protein